MDVYYHCMKTVLVFFVFCSCIINEFEKQFLINQRWITFDLRALACLCISRETGVEIG
jgi:hypothetical protein